MTPSRKTRAALYPVWLTNLLGALFFFMLGFAVYSVAADRRASSETEALRQQIAAVEDSVLLLAQHANLSDAVRQRILEDTGVLRGRTLRRVWAQRDAGLARSGRRDTVQISAMLLDALLNYYQQWGDLRGAITLKCDPQVTKPVTLTFDSLEKGRELVTFIGRYRGKLSLHKVEFLPLDELFESSTESFPASLKSLSVFLIDARVGKASVVVDMALSPSFAGETR